MIGIDSSKIILSQSFAVIKGLHLLVGIQDAIENYSN